MEDLNINVLVGKTLASIKGEVGDEEMIFTTTDGEKYKLFHYQDCCESVSVEDICGDINDLVGSPIILSEEVSNYDAAPKEDEESFTWTFYRIQTAKGLVTIRWYGSSNGYYSESVSFEKIS